MSSKVWEGVILIAYKLNPTRILLIENVKTGNVSPVSGALENNETHIQALIRESKEEVVWDLHSEDIVESNIEYEFVFGSNKPERAGDLGRYRVFFYNASNIIAEPKSTKDTKNPRWIEKENVLEQIKFEDL